MELLNNIPVEYNIETLLSNAHIKLDSKAGKELEHLIEAIHPHVQPKAMYQVAYIQTKQEQGVEIDEIWFTSKILSINLEQVERVFPFVATCGTEVEELSQQETDLLYRYALDAFKQHILRQAVTYLREHITKTYSPGTISMMNPGSLKDWPLREQRQVFSLLGDVKGTIGVELTESFLMHPVKSVSGIIFPTDVSFENCQLCPRDDCPSRRAPYDEMLLNTKYC